MAQELIGLFRRNGHDVDDQVALILGDMATHNPPDGINVVASIGLLHNYYSLEAANALVHKWFAEGASKVITDVCYDPVTVNGNNAQIKTASVKVFFQ